ncbi:MAG: hypothetical protein NTY07_05325 [Bacteroidia bacterium]|nr:hypothetical protein [Bacteroidia bacterium]
MRKTMLSMAVLAFMVGTISGSFGQDLDNKSLKAKENIQEAPKNVVVAKQDLKGVQKTDAISEFQKFRKESEIKIKSFDNRIGDLKVTFYQNKIKNKESYQDNLNILEQKNDNLNVKLTEYNVKEQNKWASFKLEFNHDLDEIGKSLKDFAINNK